jgi:LuxR family transcriptional regulator, maltose regulon positive regulatory protein
LSRPAEQPNLRCTKLTRPRLAGDVVRRACARERLERNLDRPLTLVCAPAGYGKTTLLSAWLAESGYLYAWLSLDESDSDPAVFLSYLTAAIRTAYPEACPRTLDLLRAPSLPPQSLLVTALANDLDGLARETASADARCLILVLDDYHLVRSEAVHALLADLLRHPPRTVHLILSTRQDPPLPLSVLRARGEMGEIRVPELRFTPEEVALFMRQAVESPLEEQEIAFLAERTEGWPAGLRLAALTLTTNIEIRDRLSELPADNRYVVDYLMGEVLSHVPASTQEFLLKTSILDRLSGPLCDAVAGTAGAQWSGQAYLEWMAQQNLFTWSVDPHRQWYRYHRLFQRLLHSRLEDQYSPDEIADLHLRASAWFAESGLVDEAIEHALAANDVPEAARLVEAHRHEAMNQERWLDLQTWLSRLSRHAVDERPELVLAEAWLLHHRASLADVAPRLARAEALLQQTPLAEEAHRSLQGEIDALTSQLVYWTADAERTLDLARHALAETPSQHFYVRALAWMFAASGLHMRGELGEAIETLHEGLREDSFHHDSYTAHLLTSMCFIYWMTADLPNLLQTGDRLFEVARGRALSESLDWAHYFRGCATYQQNNLAAAARDFGAVVAEHQTAHGIVFPHSAFGLASVYEAQHLEEQARATIEPLAMHALEVNSATLLADVRAFAAHLALAQGRAGEAADWAAGANRNLRMAPMPLFCVGEFTLVEALLAQGTPASLEEAARLLHRLHEVVQTTHNTRFLIDTLALQALLHDARRERSAALEALKRAVALAEPSGVVRVFVDLGPKMAALLHQLAAGQAAPGFVARLLEAFPAAQSPGPAPRQTGLIEPLSDRELEVVALLAQRLSNKEIAHELSISPMTVKRHTVNIYQKLLVSGRREAVARAGELGILPLSRG